MEDVKQGIFHILNEDFELDGQVKGPESDLESDLGLDSLDQLELIMKAEDKFDISISDSDTLGIKTVGDLIAAVEKNLGAPA